MAENRGSRLAPHAPRASAARALLTAGLLAAALAALIIGSAPRIVTAPRSELPTHGPAAAPAIAELRDGGYEVVSLRDVSYVGTTVRSPAAARALHVAVALVNFADGPAEPFDPASVKQTVFGETNSVAHLYAEQSFGLARLSGDVFGWLTIDRGSRACDFSGWAEAASATIGEAALSSYTNLMVVFPADPACEWSGLAYVGGSTAWVNGEPTVRAVAHELGHNLGLGHASSLGCAGSAERLALGSDCEKEDEYGDPFSLMGSGGTLHLNGIHKRQLGWLAPENVVEVRESGVFELAPLGGATDRPQVLRMPHGKDSLVVEYRSQVAEFERFGGPFEPLGGVTARIAQGPDSAPSSLLVDATPTTRTHADAQIAVDDELVDPTGGLRLITRALEADHALVEVVFAGDRPDRAQAEIEAPAVIVATATPGRKRSRVDLTWRASPGRISHYLVIRNGRVVARPKRPRLTRFERHGSHTYRVRAVGRDGRRSAASTRLALKTDAPRHGGRAFAPLRGVSARPTRDGRVALSAKSPSAAVVYLGRDGASAALPRRGALALQLRRARSHLHVRPRSRPDARAVRIVVVRAAALAG